MNKSLKNLFEWVGIIAFAFILSFIIRTFFIDTRIVPTGSMLPTIQLQDRLIVDKQLYKFSEIERGDIVVFQAPLSSGEKDELVKRIIGLPGEEIRVTDGIVLVNGKALEENYLQEKPDYQYDPVQVPADSYFVLGDNRRSSNDSHMWGFVPKQNIKGKVWIRYWPLNSFGKLES